MRLTQPGSLLPLYSSNTETYAHSCSLLPLSSLETHEKSNRTLQNHTVSILSWKVPKGVPGGRIKPSPGDWSFSVFWTRTASIARAAPREIVCALFEGISTASDGPQIEPSWSAQVCPGDFGSEIMHITHFMSIMQFIAIMQVYINTSKNTGGSVSSHSLISISCCLNVVVSSCKLHSLLHSDRTIWRMWNYHRSRDSMASTLVFEGWGASTLVIKVLWWSSIIVEMLNRRFFVVRIDIIWKRGLIMHKLCTLCNLCKLLHSYVIYAFYVTDCIIMQIMNISCIVVKIKLIITAM